VERVRKSHKPQQKIIEELLEEHKEKGPTREEYV